MLSLISDIKTYKIKNNIVYPFILAGLITNIYLDGLDGLMYSVKGIIIPIILLIVLFILRMLGAGDIKLFSAIGSIMGFEFTMYSIMYSFLAGGAIALLLIIFRKNGIKRLVYLFQYIKSCFLIKSILPYTSFEDKSDGAKFRFAFAVVGGVGINLYLILNT
ncbi:A24 family peptidase [Wukongibacter sp. M2B1]